ncbi:MAG: DNA-directed RNA polymerase subunit beta' [Holosporales bacterium]|jgi:DNA-directed RNA polymerase subunit beta'|nr:DNA-directed RNA polymerase subunit beta' [Holosporales bacterium]
MNLKNDYAINDKVGVSTEFDAIRISIASPDEIRSWSFGEVKKPETINYRTFKPERDGLFCARIFGPVKDYECNCGRYKRMKYKGIVCEKCGVEITLSRVRRERMGHIELAAPVVHVWFMKSIPSRISMILDRGIKELEKILYFEKYVVLEPGFSHFQYLESITEEEYQNALDKYGEGALSVNIGAEAIRDMLRALDLHEEVKKLKEELESSVADIRKKRIVKRLKILKAFIETGAKPEYLVMTVLPVIPPELRPLVPLEGGRFATSDLNDLYRRVINRNNRLKRLIELRAPDIIIRNEKRMLQESVDALFDNKRRGAKAIVGANKRPLKSLSDMLKGKQGRFRQNLLGKRVDYSGRSVIIVGPELKLHQCGLPKKMALELFRPFVYAKLEKYGLASTLKSAKRMIERDRPEVWDILEEVIREHPVLLNRAPTLHRLSIQAFEPVLIEGKAIQLHPLVCSAFNADFDGDQMAVHIPLSLEAQLEARILMLSTNNILSPSNGKPIVVPSKDIVLGVYYLTLQIDGLKNEGACISGTSELMYALEQNVVTYHTKIRTKIPHYNEDGATEYKLVETTPGRVILSQYLPKHPQVQFELINKIMTSSDISALIDAIYFHCGSKATAIFVDKLKEIGFKYMTLSGISYGKDDLVIPNEKEELVNKTKKIVGEFEQQYLDGFITQGEKYNKVVDAWNKCGDKVAEALMKAVSSSEQGKQPNSVYMMIHSKARGSVAQLKQSAGMRGLMAKPTGEIIETPIVSNFKEGLSILEYFISTHGSRKGLTDTALKTANSGYLTRRLVDVANDCVVTEEDCKTTNGILMKPVYDGSNTVVTLKERILGRFVSKDLIDPNTGILLLPANGFIDEYKADKIINAGIDEVWVRSAVTCDSKHGVCAKCYGRDLARGTIVCVGETVGVIAAQSIGEPGTQLTMRTFHIGGAAQKTTEQSSIEASMNANVAFKNMNFAKNSSGDTIVLSRKAELALIDSNGRERLSYKVPYGAKLKVEQGDAVKLGQVLVEWDPYTSPVICEVEGFVNFVDLVEGQSLREIIDESTGISSKVVVDWKQSSSSSDYRPMISIRDKQGKPVMLSNKIEARYFLSIDAVINVDNGSKVIPGDIIARVPKDVIKTRDITGGLPRISELFEARHPKNPAVISAIDGIIEFGKDHKSKRRLIVIPEDKTKPTEYLIPKGRSVLVHEGDYVKKGDILVDGNLILQDILRILGVESMAMYLVNEIQQVYRLQGIPINDKHIEIIVKQMLQKREIKDSGDSTYIVGDEIDKEELSETNTALLKAGQRPIIAIPVIQGITRASLLTKSFISAASFQETTRVLTEAAIYGKIDYLAGLKENVIVGRLIPAGTGGVVRKWKKEAEQEIALKENPYQDLKQEAV